MLEKQAAGKPQMHEPMTLAFLPDVADSNRAKQVKAL